MTTRPKVIIRKDKNITKIKRAPENFSIIMEIGHVSKSNPKVRANVGYVDLKRGFFTYNKKRLDEVFEILPEMSNVRLERIFLSNFAYSDPDIRIVKVKYRSKDLLLKLEKDYKNDKKPK